MEENDPWDRSRGVRSPPASVDVQKVREQLVGLLPRLRRFARSLARNAQEADDLVQVAIERALARADQLRLQSHPVRWLLGIVRGAWLDGAPARRRRERVFAAQEAAEAVSELLALQEALARLPEEQHLAVALVLIEGLAYKEAAELLNVPVATLTGRLAQARETLHALLEPAGALR